ncbi:MAG: hypothetical protein ABIE23_04845 [archaeon]
MNRKNASLKKIIVLGLILLIIGVVFLSGPATAFYITATPTLTHTPGTKDANVTVTFYKERYEAIGTITARLIYLETDGSGSGTLSPATSYDVNCWANTDYYDYGQSQYLYVLQPNDLNVLAYGYVDNDATLTPGVDENSAYKFRDWSDDLSLTGAVTTYYGYGYNYAGTFTCTFYFTGLNDGVFVSALPFINGLPVNTTGYDSGQAGTNVDVNTIFAIKTIAASGVTDVNFVNASGTEKAYFSIPQGGTNGTAGSDYITIDVNIASATNPSNATLLSAPRFEFGSNVSSFTIDGNGATTLDLFYTGLITDSQAENSNFNIWRFSSGSWTKITSGRSTDTSIDRIRVTITSFSEYAMGTDTSISGGDPPATGDGDGTGGGGGDGGGGGGTPEAKEEVLAEVTITKGMTSEELTAILTEAGASETAIEKAIAAVGKTELTKTYTVYKTTAANGTVSYRTELSITVKNPGKTWLREVKVIEKIPKGIAAKASEINSEFDFSVLVEDPIIQFNIPELKPGETKEIMYSVPKNIILADEKSLQELALPILADFIELTGEEVCAEKNCDDSDPCTKDSCDVTTAECTHTTLPDGTACGAGKQCISGVCKAKSVATGGVVMPEEAPIWGWIIGIIVIVIIAGAGYYYYEYYYKKGKGIGKPAKESAKAAKKTK